MRRLRRLRRLRRMQRVRRVRGGVVGSSPEVSTRHHGRIVEHFPRRRGATRSQRATISRLGKARPNGQQTSPAVGSGLLFE